MHSGAFRSGEVLPFYDILLPALGELGGVDKAGRSRARQADRIFGIYTYQREKALQGNRRARILCLQIEKWLRGEAQKRHMLTLLKRIDTITYGSR